MVDEQDSKTPEIPKDGQRADGPFVAAGGSSPTGAVKGKKETKKQLLKQVEELTVERDGHRDALLRLQAEFENFKKRQAREKEEYRKNAFERVVREVLPILDNLERAANHGTETPDTAKIQEGVDLVVKQFQETIANLGVTPLDAMGEVFDPHVHEAMSTVETEGDPPDGTVVEVYQKGYMMNSRVLRPTMVGVAKLVDEQSKEEKS